ncbi:MAG: cyclic nucleotide-binding domain-containing protein [Rhodospirillaceae bacterium]|nr:cyclic nucleotide-binding domain-containing protein [Rhodospirillaceae bacterium]
MASRPKKSSSYEIMVQNNGSWTIDNVQYDEMEALKLAEELLGSKKFDAVKINRVTTATGYEQVIYEENSAKDKSGPKITPIDDAPVCKEFKDYYGFSSRKIIGRLLRQYLDEHFITPLELLFNTGYLNMLERNDTLYSQGMQQVAGAQARATGEKPLDRVGELYKAFAQVKDRAREVNDARENVTTLKEKGLPVLITEISSTISPENRETFIYGALAGYLSEAGDWDTKLGLLLDLAEQDLGPNVIRYVDEAIADILTGPAAVNDLIGRQDHAAGAYTTLARLSAGRYQVPKHFRNCLGRLNDLFKAKDMPCAKSVLLDRVSSGLSGITPLTKQSGSDENSVFIKLIRDIMGMAGLEGGPRMCEAACLRAKMVLGKDEGDLTVGQSIEQLMFLMPNKAIQLGFLLDLSQTKFCDNNRPEVMGSLMRLVQSLTSVASLAPQGSTQDVLVRTVEALMEKLGMGDLPEEMRNALNSSLQGLLKQGQTAGTDDPSRAVFTDINEEHTRKVLSPKSNKRTAETGDIIFNEGEEGTEAYIVSSGEVEIYRQSGNKELILAVLGQGSIIGEMPLIDNQPRMASARALENTELFIISQENLSVRLDRLGQNDKVLRQVMDVLVERARGHARSAE